jgi:hypothetical protein
MKQFLNLFTSRFHLLIFVLFLFPFVSNAQQITKILNGDSCYLPQIKITADPSSFGPYVINSKHTNVYFVSDLPKNTTKVVLKYIDSNDSLIGEPKIETGSDIQTVVWTVQANDVGFVLSPQLCIELNYNSDSTAVYKIPYLVYPDTVVFTATNGWGPFITNNYQLSNGWQPVPPQTNTFSVSNLPPRTDTVNFQILNADSTVIDSLWVYAPTGQYLDSVAFSDVRMDSLPLSARYLKVRIWCEGGPSYGLIYYKDIYIIPQNPKLISISEGKTHVDTITPFMLGQIVGQALQVDSLKHAEILNTPGVPNMYNHKNTGPYCLDFFNSSFSVESWLRLDLDKLKNIHGRISVMSVDSVWEIYFYSNKTHVRISLRSLIVSDSNELFTASIPCEELFNSQWHYIAFTVNAIGAEPIMNFYLDGRKWNSSVFHNDNYEHVLNSNYPEGYGMQPLFLGPNPLLYSTQISYITAMDEVRIWSKELSADFIQKHYNKRVLQDIDLIGYWDFDDLRNRLNYISDISFNNNGGKLKNGAFFIPQHPQVQAVIDTLVYQSSNQQATSLIYLFTDCNEQIVLADTAILQNGIDTLVVNVAKLPDNISKLVITEFAYENSTKGDTSNYFLASYAPCPVATPRYNWNIFERSADTEMIKLYNSVIVSGFPLNTTKVQLELKNDDRFINTETFTKSSIPYRYSLTFNGTDNYVTTPNQILAPDKFTVMFWFKTTSTTGGEIIGFSESKTALRAGKHDRNINIRPDGSIRLYLRNEDSTYILSANNKYNDGMWHHIAVTVDTGAYLYVDGSIVDFNDHACGGSYSGYWVMGKNYGLNVLLPVEDRVADFFKGTICEVVIVNNSSTYNWINANRYGFKSERGTTHHYKFNDGKGYFVHDYSGNSDALLNGTSKNWFSSNSLSFIVWNKNMLNYDVGYYDLNARVYYKEGADTGIVYHLGRIGIDQPMNTFLNFSYSLSQGNGYFNEGTSLKNHFKFRISPLRGNSSNNRYERVTYKFIASNGLVVKQQTFYIYGGYSYGEMDFDMGDAPPGSYINILLNESFQGAIPIYITPLIKPVISGNFGPFDQAIAPGCMNQTNTFIIQTEIFSDLNKIKGVFRDKHGHKLATIDAVKINDTIWHLTYEMGLLKPPVATLTFGYYFGQNPNPLLVQGPYAITIHKTRPKWFDFVADSCFHDISQSGDIVTFNVNTPLEESFFTYAGMKVDIPSAVPLIGGTSSKLETPSFKAYLKWDIPTYKLSLNEPPKFSQVAINFGVGTSKYVVFKFNQTQDDYYSIDSNNNLIASENFAMGYTFVKQLITVGGAESKIKELMALSDVLSTASIVVKPSIIIRGNLSFEIAKRVHLEVDTITGKWGSFGNLKTNANPASGDAYKNSAAYNFYSGAIGLELDIGAKLLDGLVGGYFGLAVRAALGFGHSYVNIPRFKEKLLKAGNLQVYGKFYVTVLNGWYLHNLWGPKLFFTYNFYNDDMSHCFPPLYKANKSSDAVLTNSSWQELSNRIIPVTRFSKMPMPFPDPVITSASRQTLFSWIEQGKSYGERKLTISCFNRDSASFDKKKSIEINKHALNSPVASITENNLSFYAWAQTRHDNKSILKVRSHDVLKDFVQAQDIWYAVYDHEQDSVIVKGYLKDNISSMNTGRAEANPVLSLISDTSVIIVWQVANLEAHQSSLWFSLLSKNGNSWESTYPENITDIDGVATNLEVAATSEGHVIATWLNTTQIGGSTLNKIMYAEFDGTEWFPSKVMLDENSIAYNFLSLNIKNNVGGMVFTAYEEDSLFIGNEKLLFLPWNGEADEWSSGEPIELMKDSIHHLQLPQMAINENNLATIAVKLQDFAANGITDKLSQVDLFTGDLNNSSVNWKHIAANQFVCDTTKQVADLQISYVGNDTLMILSNEYPQMPTNTSFIPVNGIIFGNPYENLVLRSITIDQEGEIHDLDEENFFTSVEEHSVSIPGGRLYQNYPNPCSETTTITFDINKTTKAKLELFDINGNIVATLMDQQVSTGRYEMQLNTALLKSGIYVYRLTTNNYSSSLKIIVQH